MTLKFFFSWNCTDSDFLFGGIASECLESYNWTDQGMNIWNGLFSGGWAFLKF